jgi:hypothetical protein
MMNHQKILSGGQQEDLINILKNRFGENMHRHRNLQWEIIAGRLETHPEKLWSLNEMERTGGEPDVCGYDAETDEYLFYDCSIQSPAGRRSICYDKHALESRKENKPAGSAEGMASETGIELLTEDQYRKLQEYGPFDTKTSSWIKTPDDIRSQGGALFADFRYGKVFIYHNSAQSYYSSRAFRGLLRL